MGDPLNNDEQVDCYFKSNDGLQQKESDVAWEIRFYYHFVFPLCFLNQIFSSKKLRDNGDGVALARSERSVLSYMIADLAGSKVISRNWNVFANVRMKHVPVQKKRKRGAPQGIAQTKRILVGNCMKLVDDSFKQPRFARPIEEFIVRSKKVVREVTRRTAVTRLDTNQDYQIQNSDWLLPQTLVGCLLFVFFFFFFTKYPYKNSQRRAYAVVIQVDPSICQADIASLERIHHGFRKYGMENQGTMGRDMQCGMTRDFGAQRRLMKRELSYLTETGLKRLLNVRGRGMLQLRSDTVEMQLLDIIAYQIDRHAENYFARDQPEYGQNSVLGIDLDMSWTEHRNFDYGKVRKYWEFGVFLILF
jgi:hypothetical protein